MKSTENPIKPTIINLINDECKKILKLTGIRDVYSKTQGFTRTTFNLARACLNALEKTTKLKV